jgi:hypothetical protein
MVCAALLLLGLAASAIRTSGYWPTKMPEAERRRRALRLGAVAPAWAGVAYFCLATGAFAVSHYNWWILAIVGCFGLTQVAFVTWSQRQERRRAQRRARAAP